MTQHLFLDNLSLRSVGWCHLSRNKGSQRYLMTFWPCFGCWCFCLSRFPPSVDSQILTVQDGHSSPHILPKEAVGRETISDREMVSSAVLSSLWVIPHDCAVRSVGDSRANTRTRSWGQSCVGLFSSLLYLIFIKFTVGKPGRANTWSVSVLVLWWWVSVTASVNERQRLYQFVCPRNFLICLSGSSSCSPNSLSVRNWIQPHRSPLFPPYISNSPYKRRRGEREGENLLIE